MALPSPSPSPSPSLMGRPCHGSPALLPENGTRSRGLFLYRGTSSPCFTHSSSCFPEEQPSYKSRKVSGGRSCSVGVGSTRLALKSRLPVVLQNTHLICVLLLLYVEYVPSNSSLAPIATPLNSALALPAPLFHMLTRAI